MSTIKLDLREPTVLDKNQFACIADADALGSTDLPSPEPTSTELAAGVALFEVGFNVAVAGPKKAQWPTEAQNNLGATLDASLTRYAGCLKSKAFGDPNMVKNACFEVRDTPVVAGILPMPRYITATSGDRNGEIGLSWSCVRGARSCGTRSRIFGQARKSAGANAKRRHTAADLTRGARKWLRVAVVAIAGKRARSDSSAKVTQ